MIEQLGFVEVRQRGSHKQFRHSDGRVTTVPDHRGRELRRERSEFANGAPVFDRPVRRPSVGSVRKGHPERRPAECRRTGRRNVGAPVVRPQTF
ncbi:MAG TPA: type II toxin-antitoxin system HicA family toxin [Thermoanaerobaculia bacterium]|nr:type II toxin-antitoxin system HicA family toxin [Thermoanaerobaculia bacterium]